MKIISKLFKHIPNSNVIIPTFFTKRLSVLLVEFGVVSNILSTAAKITEDTYENL